MRLALAVSCVLQRPTASFYGPLQFCSPLRSCCTLCNSVTRHALRCVLLRPDVSADARSCSSLRASAARCTLMPTAAHFCNPLCALVARCTLLPPAVCIFRCLLFRTAARFCSPQPLAAGYTILRPTAHVCGLRFAPVASCVLLQFVECPCHLPARLRRLLCASSARCAISWLSKRHCVLLRASKAYGTYRCLLRVLAVYITPLQPTLRKNLCFKTVKESKDADSKKANSLVQTSLKLKL